MDKKYIIILIVVLVGCSAFFFYVRNKNKEEAIKHMSQEYSRRIKAAKKSPSAGLRHMGQALNRYRDDKGVYPPDLSGLYPDYIPVKDFIDELEWHYMPKVGDFILRKTVVSPSKKELTASIRSDLKPAPASDNMLASNGKPKKSRAKSQVKSKTKKSKEHLTVATTTMPNPIVRPDLPKQKTKQPLSNGSPRDFQNNLESPKPELEPYPTFQLSPKRRFIKHLNGGFLVWKNEDGSLGFGNIQYPLTQDLTIFDDGEWVQISRRKPQAEIAKAAM